MKRLLFVFLTIAIFAANGVQSHATQIFEPWADIWTNIAAYETNGERNNFKSTVGRMDAKLGLHAFPLWGDTWLDPYIIYMGVYSSDPAYWNNNGAIGGGARLKPFAGTKGSGWWDEWIKDLRIFADTSTISYYSEGEKAELENKLLTDTRVGMDMWHEWNEFKPEDPKSKPDPNVPWAEMWLNIANRTTNFYEEDFNSSILNIQQKIGVQSDIGNTGIALEPYLRVDLISSGKDYTWLNHIDYGAGLRIRPFKFGHFFGNNLPWLSKFKIFAEIMSISWTQGKDSSIRPDSDFRFGIDFTLGR